MTRFPGRLRFGRITPDEARRKAQDVLGRVARGEDPADERTEARGVPTLSQAFGGYMAANPNRAANTTHREALAEPAGQPLRLAQASAGPNHPPGRRGSVQPDYRQAWLGRRQPIDVDAALDLPAAMCRP